MTEQLIFLGILLIATGFLITAGIHFMRNQK
jgi:hypothetical protein